MEPSFEVKPKVVITVEELEERRRGVVVETLATERVKRLERELAEAKAALPITQAAFVAGQLPPLNQLVAGERMQAGEGKLFKLAAKASEEVLRQEKAGLMELRRKERMMLERLYSKKRERRVLRSLQGLVAGVPTPPEAA